MLIKERSQSTLVFLLHRLFPFLLGQNLLEQKGIDQGQAHLDEMKAKDSHFLIFGAIREEFPTASGENKAVDTVPLLNDVECFLDFLSEFQITEIVTGP